ncbi:MAG: hypothetical protein ACYTFA_06095 [Planctomycetota bacterium]
MLLLLAEGGIDWNALLSGPDVVPILMVTGFAGIIGLVAIIVPQWRKAKQAGDEARLKERMIERGFTADEIETVITASAPPRQAGQAAIPFRPKSAEHHAHGSSS